MRSLIVIVATSLFLVVPCVYAETLECQGYEAEDGYLDLSLRVTGHLTIEPKSDKPIESTVLIERLGKEGWAYFADFKDVVKDGSNFSSWFEHESVVNNLLLEGLYAGVSPVIDENYSLFDEISNSGHFEKMPKRTLVIYDRGQVFAELYCYDNTPVQK